MIARKDPRDLAIKANQSPRRGLVDFLEIAFRGCTACGDYRRDHDSIGTCETCGKNCLKEQKENLEEKP